MTPQARYLLISDVHAERSVVGWIHQVIGNCKGILVLGDVTTWGNRAFFMTFFRAIARQEWPIFYVPGNHDPMLDYPLPGTVNLHGSSTQLEGFVLGGIGGSNITPFGTPSELSDEDFEKILSRLPNRLDILVSHTPPYGTICDTTSRGRHVGSKPLRRFIEERKVPLVLCGHIHEARGIDQIGESKIVNPGPAESGYYAYLLLGEEPAVELRGLHASPNEGLS